MSTTFSLFRSASQKQTKTRSLTSRWEHENLFDKGFLAVPNRFLELYAYLEPEPLTPAEAMFVLELMSFKWTDDAPFPSYERIAKRMGVSTKMARRYAQQLEGKTYLRRQLRKHQTNMFDLAGLFKALQKATEAAGRRERHRESAQRRRQENVGGEAT